MSRYECNSESLTVPRTTFNLDVPPGVDYPISIAVTNSTTNPHFRSQVCHGRLVVSQMTNPLFSSSMSTDTRYATLSSREIHF